jgi:hypothetical protein
MGTSNFYTKNAFRLYPLFTDLTEEESMFFDYKEESQFVAEQVSSLLDNDNNIVNESFGYDRSFPERLLVEFTESKMFGDVEIEVNAKVILRAGYYEGANLDYYVEFQDQNNYDNFEDSDDIVINHYNSDMNAGLCSIQTKLARDWAENTSEKIENRLEEVFTKITDPYVMVARASNGETLYRKA